MVNVFALMIVFLCFQWRIEDKPLLSLFCLTSYFYFLSIVRLQHTLNSIYIYIYICKFVSFYTVLCLSKIVAQLLLMLYYSLYICLVIFIFNKLLFLQASTGTAYNEKSCNALLLFINVYYCYLPFVALLLLKQCDVETNPGPKKFSEPK